MVYVPEKVAKAVRWGARKCGWVPVSELSGKPLVVRVFNHEGRPDNIEVRTPSGPMGLPAVAYKLNNTALTKLGINPEFARGGAEVYFVSEAKFLEYLGAFGISGAVAGVYAPTGRREVFAVMRTKQPAMDWRIRKILLPENVDALTLAHEALHDIFLNLNLSAASKERAAFWRSSLQDAWHTLSYAPSTPEAKFFEGVAARTAGADGRSYDLSRLLALNLPRLIHSNRPIQLLDDTALFVGELFAYGGTIAIGYKGDRFGRVPLSMGAFFETWVVHPKYRKLYKALTI